MTARCLLLALIGWIMALSTSHAQRTARELPSHSMDTPMWTNDFHFDKDVFTFVRIKYSVNGEHGFGHTRDRWLIDAPDSDLNFSYRLQQITSMKVNPEGRFLEITDKALFDYPFIYIVEPGRLTFTEEEIPVLRSYLLNGGFLMFDDFWGDREWMAIEEEMKKVFTDKSWIELDVTHPIFHSVFDIKEKPQIPGIEWVGLAQRTGQTWENHGPGSQEVHYRAILDDKQRIMVLFCHNTDLGDGWEREGEDEYYFREFAEKKAYPMGINIVFYAMTH